MLFWQCAGSGLTVALQDILQSHLQPQTVRMALALSPLLQFMHFALSVLRFSHRISTQGCHAMI